MIDSLLRELPLLLAGVLALGGLGFLFVRSATAALWTLAAMFVVTQAIVPPVELSMTLAGITVHVLDIVCGLMFAIGVFRLVTLPTPPAIALPLATLSFLFVAHVTWGAANFGLQAAVHPSRLWLYMLGPLVFFAHAPSMASRRAFVPLVATAVALALFAFAQIARFGLHGANEVVDVGGTLVDARPVTAGGSLLIAQCVLLALAGGFVRSPRWAAAVLLLGGAVLLLQHRTVWIVALVIGTVAYLRWARSAIHVRPRAAAAVAGVILLVLPFGVALLASSSAFAESVDGAASSGGTFGWRTASWGSLIEAHSSPEDVFLGIPTGTSLERRIGEEVATQSPHNLYLDALLSFGVLGLVALVWLWVVVVRHRRRIASVLAISSITVVLLVLSQALFGITNALGPLEGVLLGLLLQAAWVTDVVARREPASTQLTLARPRARAASSYV